MRRIFWGILALLLAWYILYYYRPPRETAVLQTTLTDFTFDILLQRQPIVLYDRVANLEDLKTNWFPRNRCISYRQEDTEQEWRRSPYKYLLLQPEKDTEMFLYPASKKLVESRPADGEVLLTIKLKAGQCVLLPYRWHYCSAGGGIGVRCLGVHDLLTPWLPRI